MSKTLAVIHYRAAVSVFRRWLDAGIISSEEFALIDDMIAEKYSLPNGSIYR